jgi:hypothetical protein
MKVLERIPSMENKEEKATTAHKEECDQQTNDFDGEHDGGTCFYSFYFFNFKKIDDIFSKEVDGSSTSLNRNGFRQHERRYII